MGCEENAIPKIIMLRPRTNAVPVEITIRTVSNSRIVRILRQVCSKTQRQTDLWGDGVWFSRAMHLAARPYCGPMGRMSVNSPKPGWPMAGGV